MCPAQGEFAMHKKRTLVFPLFVATGTAVAISMVWALALTNELFAKQQSSAQQPLPENSKEVDIKSNPSVGGDARRIEQAKQRFGSLSAVPKEKLVAPKVVLGQELFWDERLSANGKVACASCHLAENWGADAGRFSIDAKGKTTTRHSQTVFNAMLQPNLRWTGDRKSGAHQAERSLTGSMGFASAEDVVSLLQRHGYEAAFKQAFPNEANPVSPQNYAAAIQAYEETLVTPSAFDRFLGGDNSALNAEQKAGLELFVSIGCADCHDGRLLGGNSIEKFGVYKDYWLATNSEQRDGGVFETTKDESDRDQFRVSMLRNITKTAPYFHDGSVKDLSAAVRIMAKVQLDQQLTDSEMSKIVAFLESLTGEAPRNYRSPSAN